MLSLARQDEKRHSKTRNAELNMELTEKAGRYEITKAGGAGQIGDKNSGKLGQTLFSGEWRFQVVSVETVDTYKPEFNQEWVAKPKQGETLVVVHCRVKNGTMKKETIAFERDAEAVTRHGILNNALTDANEQAFSPIATDVRPDSSYYGLVSASFLPGAAIPFNMVFSVPMGTQPKSVLFSAARVNIDTIDKKHVTDFRVSLVP